MRLLLVVALSKVLSCMHQCPASSWQPYGLQLQSREMRQVLLASDHYCQICSLLAGFLKLYRRQVLVSQTKQQGHYFSPASQQWLQPHTLCLPV